METARSLRKLVESQVSKMAKTRVSTEEGGRKIIQRRRKNCCEKCCCIVFPFLLGLSVLFLAMISIALSGGEFAELRPNETFYATEELFIFIPTWIFTVFLIGIGLCFVFCCSNRSRGLFQSEDSAMITPPIPEPFWMSFPLNGADFLADCVGTLIIFPSMPIYWQVSLVFSLVCALIINIRLYKVYKDKKHSLTFQDIKMKLGMLIILSAIEDVVQVAASTVFLIDQKGEFDEKLLEGLAIMFSASIGWGSLIVRLIEAPFFILFGSEIYVASAVDTQMKNTL